MDPIEVELAALAAAPPSAAAIARALQLFQLGALQSAPAAALAAALLQHADDADTVRVAHELALQAMAAHRPARRLAATTFDRLRVLQGLPQKFGTQRRPDGTLFPVDAATTDSERAKWDLPPRRELEAAPSPDAAPRRSS